MGSLSMKMPWTETPLIESNTLSRAAGCRIFLKLENLQPSSSFKSRGIGNLMISSIVQEQQSPNPTRPIHFYSSSGGNAGLACVTAASDLGYPSTVVVPTSTEEFMILKIKAAGASDVISFGDQLCVADKYLREVVIPDAEKRGQRGIYIPPYDNPLIWEGAATMIEEIKQQMPDYEKPDAIVCSVGGGGLFAGIMNGLDRVGWSDLDDPTQVIAVETKGADSLALSLEAGKLITLPGITSIAKSLAAATVAEHVFKLASTKSNVTPVVLEDAEAVMAATRFIDDERMLVEPACGVSVALAYNGRLKRCLKDFNPNKKVVIIVCGGSRVTWKQLEKWKVEFADRIEELELEFLGREGGMVVPSSVTNATVTTSVTNAVVVGTGAGAGAGVIAFETGDAAASTPLISTLA